MAVAVHDQKMTKIVVGYDGTEPSEQAVLWAADEAARRQCPVHIVSCVDVPMAGVALTGWVATEAVDALISSSDEQLGHVRTLVLERHPELEVHTRTANCSAAVGLAQQLEPEDLVVLGASRRRGAAAFWLGSTPRQLVRSSPCPVVVVRNPGTTNRPDRVVVGVDGSPLSDAAIDWAADAADRHGVPLHVVHAWTDPFVPDSLASAQATDIARVDARRQLDGALARARERAGVQVTDALVEGPPGDVLLAQLVDGDMVVLGSHGRGALAAGMLGSTVNAVLDSAVVPVVVVRNPALMRR